MALFPLLFSLTIAYFIALASPAVAVPAQYSITTYGAKPDGKTDSTKAILDAWNQACHSSSPSTIYVPTGRFSIKNLVFRGPCKSKSIITIGNWIMFHVVDGVTISGGTLDGQGTGLWSCKSKSKSTKSCPQGATGVTIMNSRIGTGDDCISIGPGTNNLWIENISCGPGHGISIGSLGKEFHEAGVQNVTVKTVTFTGTENGVRIKSWGRPSTGFAKDILFQHVVMNNVHNPIVIDQNYCPDEKNCPGQASGVKVSDVTYQDIHGSSQTEVAVKFICSGSNPCTGLRLEDVKLTYKNKAADSSCKNADGVASGIVQPSSCL
ncbi:unnamed protein product [Linum perenne]